MLYLHILGLVMNGLCSDDKSVQLYFYIFISTSQFYAQQCSQLTGAA